METTPVEQCLEAWMPTVFPGLRGEEGIQVDRAHRTPGGKPKPGAPPCMFIARLLQYKDKLNVLTAAHAQGDVEYNGNRIFFYPDYGTATEKKHRSFMEAKKKLQEHRLVYALLPPARLQGDVRGKRHFFDEPEEAIQFTENT
ncbi:hypothetical protein NDU88_006959 [Pleurodeles waltl]|uniref:Uncharacterized protein n=1 Tax=Pleurodeles waltl TaxID=8319 RepID=A0AAV7N2W6_PLEWA|nr:hypothetical protein NDU88_006959 [Pleurodeles waltl]